MLHEMGIALLVLPLHQRASIYPQANRNLPRRHLIMADGVAQAVGQFAEQPCGVDGHIAILVEPWPGRFLLRGGGRAILESIAGLKRDGPAPRQNKDEGERMRQARAGDFDHRPVIAAIF